MRETAAQALGMVARALPQAGLTSVAGHLRLLVEQREWEARLGGLLGLKYLLAARTDCAQALLPRALPTALLGLQVLHCVAALSHFWSTK